MGVFLIVCVMGVGFIGCGLIGVGFVFLVFCRELFVFGVRFCLAIKMFLYSFLFLGDLNIKFFFNIFLSLVRKVCGVFMLGLINWIN